MNEKDNLLQFEITRKILLNANVSYHYRDKANRAKALRTLAKEIGETYPNKHEYFKITAHIFPPTRRRLDPPNLYPTVKHIIDGLTDAKIWEDDDWTHMESMTFKYGGLSGSKDTFLIKLEITEIINKNE